MAQTSPKVGFRRHGLYYPYFHVRDDRWLKVAALYWPRLTRIVPQDYRTRDSTSVRALEGDFITRHPPGASVENIAPLFLELIEEHGDLLRSRLRSRELVVDGRGDGRARAHGTTAVHVGQMSSEVREALQATGLALGGRISRWHGVDHRQGYGGLENSIDGRPDMRDPEEWVVMHPDLVAVYTSVLAEDFARANKLQPTTDQGRAYAVANDWTRDRIAAVLLGWEDEIGSSYSENISEALGFLALEIAVPADLRRVPIDQIIELRERYGAEFIAFGQAIDQKAAEMAELSDIRDQIFLKSYLQDAVAERFAAPLEDLKGKIAGLTGKATTMAINVKTELPAALTLAGGAWLAGQPLVAGAGAAAIGILGIGRGIRQERRSLLEADPAASFLLHTERRLRPRTLVERTVRRVRRIAAAGGS
ncbi:DUF6236 family protein [Nocardiopsis alba]|uniref:DUF6236 family protein n=2 Tax=Nocardiopsis alba TaxID=53437 RepID=UPI00381694D9